MSLQSSKRCFPVAVFLMIVVMLFSVVQLSSCGNEVTDTKTYEDAIKIARTETWQSINSGTACSSTIAIMDDGEIVYSEGFGMADRENSIPVESDTIFNIASISKSFCAAALMILVDDGDLKLDAPLVQYLPDFTMEDPRHKDITIKMLVNHMSGLPGSLYANASGLEFNENIYEETLDYLSVSSLKAAPGETAPYCNDAFTLAEILISRISGTDYLSFLEDRIFKPLSLDNTGESVGMLSEKQYAEYYETGTGKKMPAEIMSILGAGGLSSTAEDLVRFADTFSGKGPQILTASSIEEILSPQISLFAKEFIEETSINPEMCYGLGFDIVELPGYKEQGVKVVGKGGDSSYYHSMLWFAPEHRVSVAVIQAGAAGSATDIALDMFGSVLAEKGIIKTEVESVSVPEPPESMPEHYIDYGGFYDLESSVGAFEFGDNKLTLEIFMEKGVRQTMFFDYDNGAFSDGSGMVLRFYRIGEDVYAVSSLFGGKLWTMAGQRIKQIEEPLKLILDVNGKNWLRRNAARYENEVNASGYILESRTYPELPGYVDFGGLKRISSQEYAEMASAVLRDISELWISETEGHYRARTFDMVFSEFETAGLMELGEKRVVIGEEGYNEWLQASADMILSYERPEKGRVIVFSADFQPIYDNSKDDGDAIVPAGGLIQVAGKKGDVFTLRARQ